MNAIVLFNRDLRVSDHPALFEAVRQDYSILPVYIFNPTDFGEFEEGFPKVGPQKAKFLWESVMDLKNQFENLSGDLLIEVGGIKDTIHRLIEDYDINCLFCTAAATYEEQLFYKQLEDLIEIKAINGHSLIHPDNLPFPLYKLPKVFTPFRKKVEAHLSIQAPLPDPKSISFISFDASTLDFSFIKNLIKDSDKRTAFPFNGGSKAGKERVEDYFWNTQKIREYKVTRNGLIGEDYSSKFSPYLAWGCLSPRYIYSELKRHEKQFGENESTYWLFFELLWRDFFYFDALKKEGKFFRVPLNRVGSTGKCFEMWRTATTKDSFVNAAMNEINATGFMSNRMRQNVASYLIHDLKCDWYAGARYFESLLIDFDPASNYGNWTYLAGIGNDPRNNRKFNTSKQAEQYDPENNFQLLWNQ